MTRQADQSVYEELELIAEEYRTTKSQKSAEQLIERYKPLINMYCRILYEGPQSLTIGHQYTMQFLSRFTKDYVFQKHAYMGTFKKGDRKYCKQTLFEKMIASSDYVSNIYKQFGDYNDYYQTACLTLLEMAERYSPYTIHTKSFHKYIVKNYHYWYRKNLFKHITKYPAKEFPVLNDPDDKIPDPYAESMFSMADRNIDLKYQIERSKYFFKKDQAPITNDKFFDINWLQGNTCSDVFLSLSKLERKIIVQIYVEKRTMISIAEELGMHRTTITKKRDSAIEKIKAALERE